MEVIYPVTSIYSSKILWQKALPRYILGYMWILRVGKCAKILAEGYPNTSIYSMYIRYLGDNTALLVLSYYTSDSHA